MSDWPWDDAPANEHLIGLEHEHLSEAGPVTEDEIVTILDEWVDDLAPLNREAFRPAARAILARLVAAR